MSATMLMAFGGCAPRSAMIPPPPAAVATDSSDATPAPAAPPPEVRSPEPERSPSIPAVPALDAGTSSPALGPPRRAPDGHVDWSPLASAAAESLRAAVLGVPLPRDPDRVWIELARIAPRLEPIALRRRAALALAARDTAAADSALAALARHRTPWQWEALRARADLVAARDPGRADAALEAADPRDWPDLERAAWLLRRARLRAEMGDADLAIELARLLVRRYAATPPAAQAVPLLEAVLATREGGLSPADQMAAAEIAAHRGDLPAATARWRAALAGAGAESLDVHIRLAEIARRAKRFEEASNVLREAEATARGGLDRARLHLEEARVQRDAGRTAAAEERYVEAARAALSARADGVASGSVDPRRLAPSALAETAFWEAALAADDNGDEARARHFYDEVARLAGPRGGDAARRRGLLFLADGAHDSARAALAADSSRAGRFWQGLLARRAGARAAGDSLLRTVAAAPGFGFYETAARESLGVRGWPGSVARDSCPADASCATLALARDLIVVAETPGFPDAARARSDAALLVSRFTAGETRASGEPRTPRAAHALLAAARLAYALGRLPAAIRFARDAAEQAVALTPGEQWAIAPWIVPGVFDALYQRLPAAARGAPDRALVQALTWQESKFDPRARSRSNALGLMQLKLAAATDAMRFLGERGRPTEAKLFDPATNVRWGVAYIDRLFQRFGGWPSVALAAYNAGPGRVPPGWRTWVAEGGDALMAELVPYPETRDYVKRILALRHAYRELAPSAAR